MFITRPAQSGFLFSLWVAMLLWTASSFALYEAQVISVIDGDTVKVLVDHKQTKIRLAFIDTPELKQPYGKRAKKALSDKIFGKMVLVDHHYDDRYQRSVATLFYESENINLAMVEEGHAWVYRYYTKDPEYINAEEFAKRAKLGLWKLSKGQRMPPWQWRKKSKDR
jgi:micrococcal nuclease